MMEDDVGLSVLMEVEELETSVMRTHLALQQFIKERKRDKEFDVDELPVGGVVSLSFSLLPEVRRQLKVVRNWLRDTNKKDMIKVEVFDEYSDTIIVQEEDLQFQQPNNNEGGRGEEDYLLDSSGSDGGDGDDSDYKDSKYKKRKMGNSIKRNISSSDNPGPTHKRRRKLITNSHPSSSKYSNDLVQPEGNSNVGPLPDSSDLPFILRGKFFRVVSFDGESGSTQAVCVNCEVDGRSKLIRGNVRPTSNFVSHIKQMHPDSHLQYLQKSKRERGRSSTVHTLITKVGTGSSESENPNPQSQPEKSEGASEEGYPT